MNDVNLPEIEQIKITKKDMNRLLESKDTIRKEDKRTCPKLEPYKRTKFYVNDYLDEDD